MSRDWANSPFRASERGIASCLLLKIPLANSMDQGGRSTPLSIVEFQRPYECGLFLQYRIGRARRLRAVNTTQEDQ